MARKLFGTDGIRGIANKFPLTPEMVQKIGISYGVYLNAKFPEEKHTVIIGGDTRLSTDMIKSALISGITSTGVDVIDVGIIPTPAVSYLIRKGNFSGGVVISASHNPYEYNGLKFFNREGKKFTDAEEGGLELVIFNKFELPKAPSDKIGRVFDGENLIESYEKFLESSGRYLAGLKIGIDCANGATFKIAPHIFNSLGAKVFVFNAEPDGKNINEMCGALHPEFIAEKVKSLNLNIGFAFDGDGDRCIAVDEKGNVVDGDKIIGILSAHFAPESKEVVATVMSNMGLEEFLKNLGMNLHRTPVGDKFVSEKMEEVGALIGGEQSGHIIIRKFGVTGDGILTAVILSSIVKSLKKNLSEISSLIKTYPQKTENFKVKEKPPIENLKELQKAIKSCEEKIGGRGRIFARYSGTEPLLRIMVEAESKEIIEEVMNILKEAVLKEGIVEN